MEREKEMKRIIRFISAIIVIIMLIEAFPASAIDGLTEDTGAVEEYVDSIGDDVLPAEEEIKEETENSNKDEEDNTYVLSELVGERMSDAKKFRMSDGTFASVSYPVDVHYKDESGNFVEIDNSPEEGDDDGDAVIDATKSNIFEAKFLRESREDKLYILEFGDEKIKISVEGANPSAIENITAVDEEPGKFDVKNIAGYYKYSDIMENTDIKYTVVSRSVKENVILKDRVDFDCITYVYETEGGLIFVQTDESTVEIKRIETGETVASLSAPVMWDAAGETYRELKLTAEHVDETHTKLILSWDKEWADSDERVYPVTVDPVLQTNVSYVGATAIVDDSYAIEYSPTSCFGNYESMRVGYYGYAGRARSAVKINLDSMNIPSNSNIIYAGLSLIPYVFDSSVLPEFPSETYINLHKMTSSWSESSFCWNTFWSSSNTNGYDSKIVDYVHITNFDPYSSNVPIYTWDISKLVCEWISGTSTNYGVLLKSNDETATGYTYLASSDWIYASGYASDAARPNIKIQYLDTNGLEDYYSYLSASAGRAGKAYVNKMTGNLTVTNNILSLGTGNAPIGLSMIYNSNDSSETNAYPLGKGWRLNYMQTIELTGLTYQETSRRYFKYTDGDGTAHYYLENTANGYSGKDEVNEKNILTYNSSTQKFTLSAENSGTTLTFVKSGSVWYLESISDEYGNKLTFTRMLSKPQIITKITSTEGYVVNLNYDSNTFLASVTYRNITQKTISFTYGNSAVTRVTYEDGKTVDYTYVSGTHRLNKMSDIDNYSLNFTYSGGTGVKPLRTSGITEKGISGTEGQKVTMTYGLRSMTLTDVTNGRKYLSTFNSTGTESSVVDITDNTKDAYAMYYEHNNGSTDVKNKGNLTFVSQTQKSTVNLLKNHSFESSSGQTFTVWGTNNSPTASATYSTAKANLGTHSVKLSRPAGNNSTRVLSYALANLTAGKEYTFSAYVNTSEMTSATKGATLFAYYASGSNTYSFESEAFTEATGANEWKRIFLTFKPTYSGSVSMCLSLSGATGSVYFDNIQLEEGGLSDYNLLENAGFDYSSLGWTYRYSPNALYSSTGGFSGGCGKIVGGPDKRPDIYQTVNVSGSAGDVYVASAMAKAPSASTLHGEYRMIVRFYNGSTTVNSKYINFNSATEAWHKAAGQAIADGSYTKIIVYITYYNGTNDAYFDNVTLTKDFFGNTYTYDSKGNITSTADLANTEENTFTYDGNSRLVREANITGSSIEYNYDSSKPHQLNSVEASGVTTSFSYDSYGNAVLSVANNGGATKSVYSAATHNDRGETTAVTNSLGKTTSYLYNEGLVDEITDASGAKVNYEYNSSRLSTKMTFTKGDTSAEAQYGYDGNNNLTSLTSPSGTVYGFSYDQFGRPVSTSVGNTTLSTDTYNSKGLLASETYGNGVTTSFEYDSLNRTKSISVNNGNGNEERVSYSYDGKGRPSEVKDYLSGQTTKTEYDLLDRVTSVRTIDNSTNTVEQTESVHYDDKNRVDGIDYSYLGTTQSTDYVYGNSASGEEPSVIYGVKVNDSNALSYTYDDLMRTTGKTITGANNFSTTYSYSTGKEITDMKLYSSACEGRCVGGDFNGDGYADLAVMYRCSSLHCKIYVWLSDGNGGYGNPINAYEDNNYDSTKVTGTMCAGDFNGDGKDEIAAFYDLGGASFNLHVFKAVSATSTSITLVKETWYTANGTFNSTLVKDRVTAGDYDGDGCDEIAAMYYYSDLSSKIFVFNPVQVGNTWSMSGSPWYSAAAGTFDSSKVTGRFASGDFDGDGKDEIAAMYDTGSNSMVIYVFNKNGSTSALTRETWITAGSGVFGANFVTGTFVAGNFTGDSKDDLAMIYSYPSCAWVLTYESLGDHFGNWAQRHNGKGNYTFAGMQYRVFGGNVDGAGYDEIVALYRQASCASSIYTFKNTGASTFELNNSIWNSQLYVKSNSNATSTMVASETIGGDTYTYTYDVLGNVTEIKKNGSVYRNFKYDDLGQLVREDNVENDATYVFRYGAGGNITRIGDTAYTDPSESDPTTGFYARLRYEDSEWKDLLTSRNTLYTCTYDGKGNPTIYHGGEMTWADGRLLTSYYGVDSSGMSTYTYNSSGIRTSKTENGITHEYILDGSTILCEKRSDGRVLYFHYDDKGNIFSVDYNGNTYYYVRNILGEILGLIDTNGLYVVKYTYTPYGYPEHITDGSGNDVPSNSIHIANLNPFRYKGYYYDADQELYYLNSRYYDPFFARFINADVLIQSSGSVLGYNMFAYCNNNPVLLADSHGLRPILSSSFEEETDEQKKASIVFMKRYVKSNFTVYYDITNDVDAAFEEYVSSASEWRIVSDIISGPFSFSIFDVIGLFDFYSLNQDDGPLNYKNEDVWNSYINVPFPGKHSRVLYHGLVLSPEDLGNYLYGRLGAAKGYSIDLLLFASFYVADFPREDTPAYNNEMNDQKWIILGYNQYYSGFIR